MLSAGAVDWSHGRGLLLRARHDHGAGEPSVVDDQNRLGLTLAILIIRGINVYADPFPRSATFLSFLRCTKYPPPLDFLLMTLGPAILLLRGWIG